MDEDRRQQNNARRPKQFCIRLQKVAVAIDRFRPQKNLQIARQVGDDKQHQYPAAGRHEKFLSHRGTKQIAEKIRHSNDAAPFAITFR